VGSASAFHAVVLILLTVYGVALIWRAVVDR
jgi:hypothetical protein